MPLNHIENLFIPSIQNYNGIRFARMMKSSDQNILWIDDAEHIGELFDSDIDVNGVCFICAGDSGSVMAAAEKKGAQLTGYDTDLMTLYDCASEKLLQYQNWKNELLKAELISSPIQSLIDAAAKMIGGTIVLLDSEMQAGYFGGVGNCDFEPLCKASAFGQMSWLNDMAFDSAVDCAPAGSNWLCKRQNLSGEIIRSILVFFPKDKPVSDIDTLIYLLTQGLNRVKKLFSGSSGKDNTLSSIFTKILDGTIKDECEINQLLSQTECPPLQFCTIAIIGFANKRITSSAQLSLSYQFSQAFPGSSLIVYNGRLVALISDSSRKNQPYPDFDYDKLNVILENSGAFIAFSNATSRRSMLRTNYLLVNRTLEIACCLSEDVNQRVFFYEDYVEYITIDLCAKSFGEIMGHDDIIYMTHPGVIRVYRYDKLHDTDLLNVLYSYCIKNCNVSLAAEASFMHRNTFTTRLAKLRTIFTEDLSSSEVQHRIVFSYKVLQYYEKICKVKLTDQFKQSPPV